MFTVNLALSDFLMMITHCPLVAFNTLFAKFFLWGPLGCRLYGFLGAIFGNFNFKLLNSKPCKVLLNLGTSSILSMVVIGYDRFNVIVKGLNGQKITVGKALIVLIIIWAYSILASSPPFFFGWGGYGLGKSSKFQKHSKFST